jgi:hypothetical protein
MGESEGQEKISAEVKSSATFFVRSGGAAQHFFISTFFCRVNDHSNFEILFFRKILFESHTFASLIA